MSALFVSLCVSCMGWGLADGRLPVKEVVLISSTISLIVPQVNSEFGELKKKTN